MSAANALGLYPGFRYINPEWDIPRQSVGSNDPNPNLFCKTLVTSTITAGTGSISSISGVSSIGGDFATFGNLSVSSFNEVFGTLSTNSLSASDVECISLAASNLNVSSINGVEYPASVYDTNLSGRTLLLGNPYTPIAQGQSTLIGKGVFYNPGTFLAGQGVVRVAANGEIIIDNFDSAIGAYQLGMQIGTGDINWCHSIPANGQTLIPSTINGTAQLYCSFNSLCDTGVNPSTISFWFANCTNKPTGSGSVLFGSNGQSVFAGQTGHWQYQVYPPV